MKLQRKAINQFKVQEILSLSKDTMLFNLHAHYYLIGWAILAAIVDIIIWLLYGGVLSFVTVIIDHRSHTYCLWDGIYCFILWL